MLGGYYAARDVCNLWSADSLMDDMLDWMEDAAADLEDEFDFCGDD